MSFASRWIAILSKECVRCQWLRCFSALFWPVGNRTRNLASLRENLSALLPRPPIPFLNDANRARTWCSHGNDRASYKQSEKSDESARYMLCSSWYFQPDPFSIFKFYSLWTWFASKPSSLSPYPRRTNLVLLWFRLSAQFVLFVCLFFSLKKFNFRLCKVILLTEHNNFQPCSTWLRCQVILTVYQALKRHEIAQVS